MTQERPRRRRRVPTDFVPLAQRARELGVSASLLRRRLQHVQDDRQIFRRGARIYLGPQLALPPTRPRGRPPAPEAAPPPAPPPRRRAGRAAAPGRRTATVARNTTETRVQVTVNLDGTGRSQVRTGSAMLDHLLSQLARHGLLDLDVRAQGDGLPDGHHLMEDVAITLGRCMAQAVGEGRGIRRMGAALVPLDETLAQVVMDISGRGYAVVRTGMRDTVLGDLSGDLVGHFLERFALEARVTLHARIVRRAGGPHHRAEALFKALGRALREALEPDPRAPGEIPSTRGTLRG